MLQKQIEKNRKNAFAKLAERTGGTDINYDDNGYYSFKTKSGKIHTFTYFDSFRQYRKSEFFPSAFKSVNTFYFVPVESAEEKKNREKVFEKLKARYKEKYPDLSSEQIDTLAALSESRTITDKQADMIAKPELTPKQMMFLTHGFDFRLPDEIMEKLIRPEFDTFQIQVLACGYRDMMLGYVTKETMERVTDPAIPYKEMNYQIDDDRIAYSKKEKEKNK